MVFLHRAISRERSEIRLVRFADEPSGCDLEKTPIQLQLRNASLGESDTQFAALSYTWGEAKGLVKIYIEGSPFKISPNDAYVDGIMQGGFLKTMPAFEEFEIFQWVARDNSSCIFFT